MDYYSELRLAVYWLQCCVCGLSLQLIGCTRPLCLWRKAPLQLKRAACGAK